MEPDVWADTFTAIEAAFNPPNEANSIDCIYDWNGDGSTTTREFKEGYAYVAASFATTNAETIIDPLMWMPGLYLAAKDHVTDVAGETEITSTGTTGSTPSSRADAYGVGSIYESISLGDYTAQ